MARAIETVYKGYRFRSRLEARWAVFLDGIGDHWEYEKEGYDLGPAGWYLPDFASTGFIEIKPRDAVHADVVDASHKCQALANATDGGDLCDLCHQQCSIFGVTDLKRAFESARQARFEHGEQPRL